MVVGQGISLVVVVILVVTCCCNLVMPAEAQAPGTGVFTWSQQGSRLIASETIMDRFDSTLVGSCVALSDDGNTLLIGGRGDQSVPNKSSKIGAFWIFIRTNGVWSQQGSKIIPPDYVLASTYDYIFIGTECALSADGNTALISGVLDNQDRGASWIYTRSSGSWSYQAKLVVSGSVWLSQCVGLSDDGNTALLGTKNAGAYIFTRNTGVWTQGEHLTSSDGQSGFQCKLSGDGQTAILANPLDNSNTGANWVFKRVNNVWTQIGSKLLGTDSIGSAQQGTAVSVSADGTTFVSGGWTDDGNKGAAWVWALQNGTWQQLGQKIVGSGMAGTPNFGSSVAMSKNGKMIMIGGPRDANGPLNDALRGAFWSYAISVNNIWIQQGSKLVGSSPPKTGGVGMSLALSQNGSTAASGGSVFYTSSASSDAGGVFVFTSTEGTHVPSQAPSSSKPSWSPTTSSPSFSPTISQPTSSPSISQPTANPTSSTPTGNPTTSGPSRVPTYSAPSHSPSNVPSSSPTGRPSLAPSTTVPSMSPITITLRPTLASTSSAEMITGAVIGGVTVAIALIGMAGFYINKRWTKSRPESLRLIEWRVSASANDGPSLGQNN